MVSNISKCTTGNLLELHWLGFLADEKKKLNMKGEKKKLNMRGMNEHTKQFIEDAVAGGWAPLDKMEAVVTIRYSEYVGDTPNKKIKGGVGFWYENGNGASLTYAEILLDAKAWEAVGKTRGWGEMHDYPDRVYEAWDTFFYELYNGKTVEEALSAISE